MNHLNKEFERIRSLHSLSILDTLPEEDFDSITKIAALICETEISLVSLVDSDRQWFKSRYGLDANETPREYSFCSRAIEVDNEIYIISDAREHPEFKDNPLVTGYPHIVFYAGVPLKSEEGYSLGSLCVIDTKPKELSELQKTTLFALARQVENLLILRSNKRELDKVINELKEKNDSLEQFAYVAAHDIKSPLNNIRALIKLIKADEENVINESAQKKLDFIDKMSSRLKNLVDGLLKYSKVAKDNELERINTTELGEVIEDLFNQNGGKVEFSSKLNEMIFNESLLLQILSNLIANGLKYNQSESPKVKVCIDSIDGFYQIKVSDNGIGIDEDKFESIFDPFKTLDRKDKFGEFGNGLGLSIVKKIITQSKGEIKVESKIGLGTTFSIKLPKYSM